MPPITKDARVAKKAKPVTKRTTRTAKQAKKDTPEDDVTSMKSILATLMAVMSNLTHNQNGHNRPDPRPNVSFSEDLPVPPATSMRQASPGPVFDERPSPPFPEVATDVC